MSEPKLSKEEFEGRLPFYLSGTLSDAECEEVRDHLREHPDAGAALDSARAVRTAIRAEAQWLDPQEGFEEFQRMLDLARTARRSEPAVDPGWTRLQARIASWGMSPALAILTLVVAVQLGVTLHGLPVNNESTMRGSTASVPVAELKITFKPGAPFQQVLALLAENQCRIVSGPSGSGELWLSLNGSGTATSVHDRLGASAIVEDVQILGGGG